ncbi:MAG TPA: hypothetical protein VIK28_08105 [Sedimentisphaerales bacterium]
MSEPLNGQEHRLLRCSALLGVMGLFSFRCNLPYLICRNWGVPTTTGVTCKPGKLVSLWVNGRVALGTKRKPLSARSVPVTKLYASDDANDFWLLRLFLSVPINSPTQVCT